METGAASGSGVPWSRNTRRRLDTLSSHDDEDARSAVLLQFPCEPSPTYQPTTNPSGFIAKKRCLPARLVFETRAECQNFFFWLDTRMMVSPTKLTFHFATAEPISQSASPSHSKIEKIGRRFAPLWKVLSTWLRELFPEGDNTGTFIVPALNVRSQILSINDRRNGVGKSSVQICSIWERTVV